MHGARRVICFCFLTAVLPTILVIVPLYLRHSVYADVTYAVAESDVLEMVNGVSSIFCQAHSLKMNSTFSAFQVSGEPEISTTSRKHIRLKKSMSLPDDTLEYWGFFLPKGSTVHLSVCSRFDGSRILVVKGEKTLRSCGLTQPDKLGSEAHMAQGEGKVLVTFETAQEILPSTLSDNTDVDFEGEVTENIKVSDIEKNTLTSVLENGKYQSDDKEARHYRHEKKRQKHLKEHDGLVTDKYENIVERKRKLQESLNPDESNWNKTEYINGDHENDELLIRKRRVANAIPKHKLDGGMVHGGNARNYTERDNDSSVSSFENSLLKCYDGNILLSKSFPPSNLCNNVSYLETGQRMHTTHEVVSDGYYYYIFYSDNDYVLNDIHAIFNIHKPTFQFGNYTKGCINKTECTFQIPFLSDDTVVVEVPTRDGIEHEADDITLLHSTCHPRMAVYAIFPITVLFLILGCAFL
ncbi:uncharacterized protein LOC142319584 isoform X2 [Lycorma delicatula]